MVLFFIIIIKTQTKRTRSRVNQSNQKEKQAKKQNKTTKKKKAKHEKEQAKKKTCQSRRENVTILNFEYPIPANPTTTRACILPSDESKINSI